MRRSLLGVTLCLVVVLLAACRSTTTAATEPEPTDASGGVTGAPKPVPADALPGRPAQPLELDAAGVAAEAIDHAALERLLDDAGFIAGTQRLFSTTRHGRRRTVAQVLVFETPEGAASFLDWLGTHHDELIGGTEPLDPPTVPGAAFLVVHEPDACCHSETRIILTAWMRGPTVVTLEVAGPTAREALVDEFVSMLDAAV